MNIVRAIPHACHNMYKIVSEPSIVIDLATKVLKATAWVACTSLGVCLCINPITIPLGVAVLIGCTYVAYIAIDEEIARHRASKAASTAIVAPQPVVETVRSEATRTTTVKLRFYPRAQNMFPVEAHPRAIAIPASRSCDRARPRMYIDPSVEQLILGALGRTIPKLPLDNHLVVSKRMPSVIERPTVVDTSVFEAIDGDEGFYELEITTTESLVHETSKHKKKSSFNGAAAARKAGTLAFECLSMIGNSIKRTMEPNYAPLYSEPTIAEMIREGQAKARARAK